MNKKLTSIAIIPARYASTRFPAKALALLAGKPIVQHVYERVTASGLFSRVLIATDHQAIIDAVLAFGGQAVMTSAHHQSGSDRIAEAAQAYPEAQLILNVQGDEPFIDTASLSDLISAFADPQVQMASLMTPILEPDMLNNPNIVKVVTDSLSNALYFSRSAIPCNRDKDITCTYYRHIGVYAYRPKTLFRFVALPPSKLEQTEKLEQLRALEAGIPIRMIVTDYQGIGIDTPEDLALVSGVRC
ncbi:MAG: 3-deoxy-manno-octulosonate cytidylyltransferase [Candidatus Cloacimonetes bacterium HGW-Cloacimonetes-3]|jgi:3-deoxy-manno-octulosonate cytidylyltransferase (CMP-KDO synthetase)|nr:MAG: 3-deoxy-manno-octulosonate cytidylyltransferase [Candidatus Cloacimonetes bacterium HGW-Cloacimonetes-3]